MKRFLIMMLALVMVLSLFACSKKSDNTKQTDAATVTEAPANEPVVTEEPAVEPAVTEEPAVEPAVTEEPAVEPAVTEEPEPEPEPEPAGDADLYRTWYLVGAEGDANEDYQMMLSMGLEMTFAFNADGTGAAGMKFFGEEENLPFTFVLNDGELELTMSDPDSGETETVTMPYRIEDGKLYLTSEGDTMIFADDPTAIPAVAVDPIVEPEPTEEPEPEPQPVPAVSDELFGEWYMVGGEGEQGQESYEAMKSIGAMVVFVFNADSTGEMRMTVFDETETMAYTYTAENGVLSMTPVSEDDGDTATADYRLEDGKLYITVEGSSLIFSKDPADVPARDPEPEPAPATVDVTEDVVVGTWVMTKAFASGMEIPASSIGVEMTFVFNADGSASLISGETNVDGLSWEIKDGVIALSAYGTALYDFTFDGETLTLTQSGADLIFEKQN